LHQTAGANAKALTRKTGLSVVWQQRDTTGIILQATMNTDRLLISLDNALRTLSGAVHAARPLPTPALPPPAPLTEDERRLSGALMRVNHVGEVCAQALYQAQALTARDPALREQHGPGGARGDRPPGLDPAAPGRAGRPTQRCSTRCGTPALSASACSPGAPATR
jgi:hypothetical protein